MDAAHLHLILNHLPVLGTLFGTLLLVAALALKKPDLRVAALVTLVLAGGSSWPAFATGHEAEEIVEHQANVSHAAIELHEEAAEWANRAALVMAVLALAALVSGARRPTTAGALAVVTLVAGVLVTAMMARTAFLGGAVAHPELRAPGMAAGGGESSEHEVGGEAGEHEAGDRD